jgi:hypothetical protein
LQVCEEMGELVAVKFVDWLELTMVAGALRRERGI